MPMNWTDAADAKLFAAVVATVNVSLDYKTLAAIMGPECTPKAVTHRIAKLREIAKGFDISQTDGTALPTTPTPKKRGRKPKATASNEDKDDDESPTKKKKATPKAKKSKEEPEAESDGAGKEDEDEDGDVKVNGESAENSSDGA